MIKLIILLVAIGISELVLIITFLKQRRERIGGTIYIIKDDMDNQTYAFAEFNKPFEELEKIQHIVMKVSRKKQRL